MNAKEIIFNLAIGCIFLIIIIGMVVIILNQLSPFKECENNKNDSYIVHIGKEYFTCGELKAINTTIS